MTVRLFVTGGAGFIGAPLVHYALADGADVLVLHRTGSNLSRLADVRHHIRWLHADLADTDAIQNALLQFKPTHTVHLAWYAEPGQYLTSPQNVELLHQSLALTQVLIRVGCQKAVMVGTCAEYDTDVGYLKETSPTRPNTIYAACKLALGHIASHLAQAGGMSFVWARLFYLYGRAEDPRRLVPALIHALRHDQEFPASTGEQIRDYMHADDVARALWHLARHDANGVYNISSGEPTTIRALMTRIGDQLGKTHLIRFGALPPRPWDPPVIFGDNTRLRQTGFMPHFSLDSGLADVIAATD